MEQNDVTMSSATGWEHVRVLVVDDSDLGRQMVRALLDYLGMQVAEAVDGAEAVEYVQCNSVDIILMDIQMPNMDGLEATGCIRAIDGCDHSRLPIIAMTANTFVEQQKDNIVAGMNGQLNKPIELAALVAEFQRWFPNETILSLVDIPGMDNNGCADLTAALPGVDVCAGIRRVMGDRQAYLQLLGKYADQFTNFDVDIQRDLLAQDYPTAVRRAHTLKGVTGSLGANALHKEARQLEQQLQEGQFPSALVAVARENQRLLDCIAVLPRVEKMEEEVPPGTEDELRELFPPLLVALEQLQVQHVKDLFTRVQQQRWPEEYSDCLRQLDTLISQYQFVAAAALIAPLVAQAEGDTCE